MTDFGTLTVAFQSPNMDTETLPVDVSRLSRLWHKLTRKPLPTITQEVPYVHTVTVDDSHDTDAFERVAESLETAGYTIVSAVVSDGYMPEELVSRYHVPSAQDISALFRGMVEDSYRANAYVAYVLEYGWDADSLSSDWMDDRYHGSWDSAADYVQNLVEDCYSESVKDIPDFVTIDWEDTADNLNQDYDYVRYYGETHVFSIN